MASLAVLDALGLQELVDWTGTSEHGHRVTASQLGAESSQYAR